MNGFYIKFSSVTYAQQAQEALLKKGMRSRLGRNTSPDRRKGCNYALYLDCDAAAAYETVERAKIKNLGLERRETR